MLIDGILQFPQNYASSKPASFQVAPRTPDFDQDAADAVAYEGLPPLAPQRSSTGIVAFTGVADAYVYVDADGEAHIANVLEHVRAGVVVVEHGRVVCAGTERSCASLLDAAEVTLVDLQGGAIQPALTGFSSSIGLEEIATEPSTADGSVLDPLAGVPGVAGGDGYLAHALDGLQYATRNAL